MLIPLEILLMPLVVFTVGGYCITQVKRGMLPLRARIRRTVAVIDAWQGPGVTIQLAVRLVNYRNHGLGDIQWMRRTKKGVAATSTMLDARMMRELHSALATAADSIDNGTAIGPTYVQGYRSAGIQSQYEVRVEGGDSPLVSLSATDNSHAPSVDPNTGMSDPSRKTMLSSPEARKLGEALGQVADEVGFAPPKIRHRSR